MREVDLRQAMGAVRQHDLDRVSALDSKDGSPGLVPAQDLVEGTFERRGPDAGRAADQE
jgi:hypothetical protein